MKNSILLILLCVSSLSIAQKKLLTDCLPCSATLTIDTNSLLTQLVPQGIQRQRLNSSTTGSSLLAHSSVWMGGMDPGGNLKFAGEITEKAGSDFYPGPLDMETGLTDFETCKNWDRFFVMKRQFVCDLDSLYNMYVIEQGIEIPIDSISLFLKTWPASSNPYFEDFMGFPLPNDGRPLAEFWDENGDGIYDPGSGDFPNIWSSSNCNPLTREMALGRVPDEFAFWIFNDTGGIHSSSQSPYLNLEVHGMAFANDVEGVIGQSIVHMYKFINHGHSDIREAYIGLNLNPQIGCSEDDFFGFEAETNLFYSYNQDDFDGDEDCICGDGENSWCDVIPMHGVKLLDKVLAPRKTTITALGDTILSNPELGEPYDTLGYLDISHLNYYNVCMDSLTTIFGTCMPEGYEEYYEILNGKFTDGTPVTTGGNGYNIGSVDSTSFVFPNAPNNGDWSMCSSPQEDLDYRPVMSFGPLLQEPGAMAQFSFVTFYVDDVVHPCPSLDALLEADRKLAEYHDNCFVIEREDKTISSNIVSQTTEEIEIHPNPFNNQLVIKSQGNLKKVTIFNISGKIVLERDVEKISSLTISTSLLDSGVYFVKINDDTHFQKLIKRD